VDIAGRVINDRTIIAESILHVGSHLIAGNSSAAHQLIAAGC
jgi:hypothetical protein